MYCRNCGKVLNENDKFCNDCGTKNIPVDEEGNNPQVRVGKSNKGILNKINVISIVCIIVCVFAIFNVLQPKLSLEAKSNEGYVKEINEFIIIGIGDSFTSSIENNTENYVDTTPFVVFTGIACVLIVGYLVAIYLFVFKGKDKIAQKIVYMCVIVQMCAINQLGIVCSGSYMVKETSHLNRIEQMLETGIFYTNLNIEVVSSSMIISEALGLLGIIGIILMIRGHIKSKKTEK